MRELLFYFRIQIEGLLKIITYLLIRKQVLNISATVQDRDVVTVKYEWDNIYDLLNSAITNKLE